MKFDAVLLSYDLKSIPDLARSAETLGFDGFFVCETNSDPFLGAAFAASASRQLTLGTSIAVAFARSPATLAYLGYDLAALSGGRFIMGLGAQVRAHNERRFGVKWEKPLIKMRETIQAMRAFWATWQTGAPFRFDGEFYNLSLMTPFFSPARHTHRIPVYIAAVNEGMLRLAGDVCDGVFLHALHTRRYLTEYALPHLLNSLTDSGRGRHDMVINTAAFVVPTDDPVFAAKAEAYARQQIAFYMSTPAYKIVTDIHSWQATAETLSRMAREGRWAEMPHALTDDILDAMIVTGTWAALPGKLHDKYGTDIDRISYYLPYVPAEADEGWRASIAGFKAYGG